MTTTLAITPAQIANLFVSAIEGGSTSWCRSVLFVSGSTTFHQRQIEVRDPWYSIPELYAEPFELCVVEHEANREGASPRHTVTYDDLVAGLKLMADGYPTHFADVLEENDDADTADLFLQLVALKDVVYC